VGTADNECGRANVVHGADEIRLFRVEITFRNNKGASQVPNAEK
jgi:hypothetical protein